MSTIYSPKSRTELLEIIKANKDKKIILKFQATWCEPCRRIRNIVASEFDKLDGEKLLILVDVDNCSDVASYFKIRSLPTLISYKDGERHAVLMNSDEQKIKNFFKNW